MADSKLSRSISSAGTTTKGTYSCWVKRSRLTEGFLFLSQENGNNNFRIRFNSLNLQAEVLQGGSVTGTLSTTRLFRDTSNWYHIVVAIDSTLATANDRMKIYVNGTQESSFSARTNPSQNANMSINEAGTQYVGAQESSNYLDGYLSHVHYIDGTAYAASTFGETDSTSGIWKPKTAPSVTYGTNGFFLKFENSAAMGTDSSGSSNNLTPAGNLKQTVDSPSNNFPTLDRADRHVQDNNSADGHLTFGNTTLNTVGTNALKLWFKSSIGVTKGKWYWEMKRTTNSSFLIGLCYQDYFYSATHTAHWDQDAYLACSFQEKGNGNFEWAGKSGDGGVSDTSISASAGTILGFALDMDNYALYAHHNGTYFAVGGVTGVPTSGASKTGSLLGSFTSGGAAYVNSGEPVFPFAGDHTTGTSTRVDANFGNGFFGTTAVASANADANGLGAFEYAVPSGYYALNTKNLKEFG